MKSTHQHKKCGGELFHCAADPAAGFMDDFLQCNKCGYWWSIFDYKHMPYARWKEIFVGYHPQQAEEKVLVEIDQGKVCFNSVRRRGDLNSDGTLKGETGTWRSAKL